MAAHNELGLQAEEMAAVWLEEKGFEILHRNWRHGKLEIDIIARKTQQLHIVEVKALQHWAKGLPENGVTKKKFRFLVRAAEAFLDTHKEYRHVQFDVVAITIYPHEEPEIVLIEDVFL